MEAPINIVVESPDGKAAELVGRAIGQTLQDTYGFKDVMVGHVVADKPGFRAWHATTIHEEKPESLLDAMRDANPQLFQAPVTVISQESPAATLRSFTDIDNFVNQMRDTGVTVEQAQAMGVKDLDGPTVNVVMDNDKVPEFLSGEMLQDVSFKLPGEASKPASEDVQGLVKAAELLGIRVEKVGTF